jgi:scyllo-inositol 2-dehydrogenase (NAD+)
MDTRRFFIRHSSFVNQRRILSSDKKLRIAIVGLGRMGCLHLNHLLELCQRVDLIAVADSRPENLQEISARLGLPGYEDPALMLEKERPEALVIATPPASHPLLIQQAARRGINVFCEKPLALTREEALATARAVADRGALFQLGFQRRFDRAYRDAHDKIREGQLGTLLTFKAIARDAWQPNLEYARLDVSGGLLLDMAIHDFDLARWLMGSEVARVSTEGNSLLYPQLTTAGDIDNAVVNLTLESGAIGNIEASRTGTYGYDIRTEVVGTRGALYIGPIEDHSLLTANGEGFRRSAVKGFEERFRESYKREITEFVDCVLERRAPECGIREGILSLEIALAARESLHTGSPVAVRKGDW